MMNMKFMIMATYEHKVIEFSSRREGPCFQDLSIGSGKTGGANGWVMWSNKMMTCAGSSSNV